MAGNVFYETATTRGAGKIGPRHIARYLQERFAEEQRKNPHVIGGTFEKGKITFRYTPEHEKRAQQALELLKTKLWWAKYRAATNQKATQTPEWQKTKLWLAEQGIY